MIGSQEPCHLSEYNVEFKKYHDHKPRPLIRPPLKSAIRDAKMESKTTSRRDFITHSVTPPVKKGPVVYQPPEGKMSTSTEYKNSFLGKWQTPLLPIVPARKQSDCDRPFDHTTTHKNAYLAPPIVPRKAYGPQNAYEPPKDRFDGSSTAHSDYVDYGAIPVTPMLKPPEVNIASSQPLDGKTSYRSDFVTPSMPQKFQMPKEVYVPSGEKFADSTTSRSAYPKHPVVKIHESKKPAHGLSNTDRTPFETNTTNRQAYKVWELPKKVSRPPTVYTPPTEKISDQTTSKVDYRDFGHVTVAACCKPPSRKSEKGAPFETKTTQNTDYKPWTDVKRTQPIRPDQQYKPPEEKLDTTTTFKTYYKGTHVPRAASTKPVPETYAKSSDIDFTTSYAQSFSGPGYKLCPSIKLLQSNDPSKFTFSHQDSNGHKFYVPIVKQ